jgi:hypothetical protein
MSNTNFVFRSVLVAVLGSELASASTVGRSYVNPKLSDGEVEVHKACITPPEGKLSKLGMKGKEGMSKESDAWSAALQELVASHLKAAGVRVLSSGMSSQELEKDPELQQEVIKLQEKYDSILVQIDKHPKDTRKARFSIGDEVTLLPCAADADTLVYVNGHGQVLTGGKKAFGMLVAAPSSSTAFLTLSLVDAKSGDVLAYLRLANNGKFLHDSEKAYGTTLNKIFKRMKIGSAGGG